MAVAKAGARLLDSRQMIWLQRALAHTSGARSNNMRRWGIAVASFAVAFAVRYALNDRLPTGFPYLTFFPAVIVATFVCGLAPGIAVAIASGLAALYFFIPPFESFLLTPGAALALAFFAVIVAIDIALIHWMQQAVLGLEESRSVAEARAAERDLLFKELQHRVSNNLAVVSSLLGTQARAVGSEEARLALRQAATRIGLIAKIQRELHDPAHQNLDFGVYLRSVVPDLLNASGLDVAQGHITAEPVVVSADVAVPLGLIATELIANAIEHGLAERPNGRVEIILRTTGSTMDAGTRATLIVRDDGPGWPHGFALENTQSLGMRIVQSLAASIDGRLQLTNEAGASARLDFKPL